MHIFRSVSGRTSAAWRYSLAKDPPQALGNLDFRMQADGNEITFAGLCHRMNRRTPSGRQERYCEGTRHRDGFPALSSRPSESCSGKRNRCTFPQPALLSSGVLEMLACRVMGSLSSPRLKRTKYLYRVIAPQERLTTSRQSSRISRVSILGCAMRSHIVAIAACPISRHGW